MTLQLQGMAPPSPQRHKGWPSNYKGWPPLPSNNVITRGLRSTHAEELEGLQEVEEGHVRVDGGPLPQQVERRAEPEHGLG